MRKSMSFLITTLLLILSVSLARAESSCGSDTSSDPLAAMGKDIWLNGYCKDFKPCRQVLEAFDTCRAAEGFLSRFEAKEGQPLTEDQVADALGQTTGTSTNMSACLWNFDSQGCKRYLGVSVGASGNTAQAESSTILPSPSSAEARKKAMSQNAALVARQRVRDMDANAHTAVGVIERACRAGADECRNTLSSLVTPVIRATDDINTNTEYLAHFPPHSPTSTEYAKRLGWTQNSGQWVFDNINYSSGGTTLGTHLLTDEECRKLHDRLGRQIKSKPSEEPVELSFLEAECLPRMPEYRSAVTRWRLDFKDAAAQPTSTGTARLPLDPKTTEDLSQWDGGLRRTEQARIKVRQEAELQAAQQKKREEEEFAKQQAMANASISGNQANSPEWDPTGGAQTICRNERASYIQAFRASGKPEGMADSPYFRGKAAVSYINLGNSGSADAVESQIALKRERIENANKELQKGGKYNDSNFHRLTIAQANYDICLIQTLRHHKGNLDLQALTGGSSASADRGSSNAGGATGGGKDIASCESALKQAEAELGGSPSPQQGALASLQFAMWVAKKGLTTLETSCPNSGKYADMRKQLQQGYDTAAAGCRQLKAGGGECSPQRN